MDGIDRPLALLCERRAIPTGISNYPKYLRFVAAGGTICAQPECYVCFRILSLQTPDRKET